MKNAHPTPRGKAGGAGQGTAIVPAAGAAVEHRPYLQPSTVDRCAEHGAMHCRHCMEHHAAALAREDRLHFAARRRRARAMERRLLRALRWSAWARF